MPGRGREPAHGASLAARRPGEVTAAQRLARRAGDTRCDRDQGAIGAGCTGCGGRPLGFPLRKVYRGKDIEVSFDLDLCVHVAECLRGDPKVFKLERRPWVLTDEGQADGVAEVVMRCPSGALLFRRLDGGPQESHAGTTVTPIRNGPLHVIGTIQVRRDDGTVETLPRATLCRCGHSNHMPF